jgi:hypothetical protein
VEVADSLYAILKSLRADERLEFVWTEAKRKIAPAKDRRRRDTRQTLLKLKADAPPFRVRLEKSISYASREVRLLKDI